MSLKWVDCDLPVPEERTPEQIRKNPASLFRPSSRLLFTAPPFTGNDTVASFQYSITKEVIWPLMELMQSTSPSSYNTVLELDKKLRELSAAVNIYEDEQFNATPAALEWSCILGANVRQAGECGSLFPFVRACSEIPICETTTCVARSLFPFSIAYLVTWEWNDLY